MNKCSSMIKNFNNSINSNIKTLTMQLIAKSPTYEINAQDYGIAVNLT